MQAQQQDRKLSEQELTTPAGAPYSFTVRISKETAPGNNELLFHITAPGTDIEPGQSRSYRISQADHQSYLNLFAQLSQDFGLRLPQNRRPSTTPAFDFPYHELLLRNETPGMLYGYGDPAVLRVDEGAQGSSYYLLATSNDAPDAFPILRSPDGVQWEFVSYVFPEGRTPPWAAYGENISDYWAPELHRFGSEFRVYYVARDKETHELCIGMARSHRPEGPYTAEEVPLLKENVIDPHVYIADADTAFLYWKKDNNEVWPSKLVQLLYTYPQLVGRLFEETEDQVTAAFVLTLWPWIATLEPMDRFLVQQILIEAVSAEFTHFRDRLSTFLHNQPPDVQAAIRSVVEFMKTPVYGQRLSPDGTALVGERVKVMENDLRWEAHLIEGIWVTRQGDKYFLFYAGNDFSTDQYGIGVAVADNPLGPYRKMPEPLLRSTARWWAPGHPSIAEAPDGTPHMFLHAYYPHKAGYKQFRALLAIPLRFDQERVSFGAP